MTWIFPWVRQWFSSFQGSHDQTLKIISLQMDK